MGQRADRVAAGLCGVGAVALLASTFMRWYTTLEGAYFDRSVNGAEFGQFSEDGWSNAWESFAGVDIALAVCAAAAAAAAGMLLARGSSRIVGAVAIAAGIVGLGMVVWRIVDQPVDFFDGFGVGLGGVVAACAAGVIAAGGVVAVSASD